jgi:hypothetical protein
MGDCRSIKPGTETTGLGWWDLGGEECVCHLGRGSGASGFWLRMEMEEEEGEGRVMPKEECVESGCSVVSKGAWRWIPQSGEKCG